MGQLAKAFTFYAVGRYTGASKPLLILMKTAASLMQVQGFLMASQVMEEFDAPRESCDKY